MDYIAVIKEWLIPISTFIMLISTAVGIWLSLKEYRLKLQSEVRLKDASRVEMDVQLLKLFTEIMDIAHARGGYHVSEKAIEYILTPDMYDKIASNGKTLEQVLSSSIITLPVGFAAQEAAIATIAALGKRHEILRPVAIQALKSLSLFKMELAESLLKDLEG